MCGSNFGIENTKRRDSRGCYSNIEANVPCFMFVLFWLESVASWYLQESSILDVFQKYDSYLRLLLIQNRLHRESHICSKKSSFILVYSIILTFLFHPLLAKHHSTALLLHLLQEPCCAAMDVARHGCCCFG